MIRSTKSRKPLLDRAVVEAGEATANAAIEAVLSSDARQRGVIVRAPAGAGKSYLVSTAVCRTRDQGMGVAVAAPTNQQAFGLVRTISSLYVGSRPGETVTFVPASDVELPPDVAALPGVQQLPARQVGCANLIVGTLSKLGDAFSRGDLGQRDVLLIDESYQADSTKYYAVGALAPLHLLVGDGGQISPFSTIDDPARWRGLPEDPLQTAVGVLRRNHPTTPVYGMPISRRLDSRAVRIAQNFYPNLGFDATVLPGVRQLQVTDCLSVDRRRRRLDQAIELAVQDGWAHLELPRAAVLQTDEEAMELIVSLVDRLFDRTPRVRCERSRRFSALRPSRVAVGVSHNDQKDLLRLAFDRAGLHDLVVETANKLQGLEFEVVVVWHPLSGLPEPDPFHLDPGRLCVLLSRHRHACFVVGREGDRELLEDQPPPTTPAYLGCDEDPVLDGWETHGNTFEALGPFRIQV